MPISRYVAQQILNGYLRGVAMTPPTINYVSLHTADPTDVGTVGEVTLGAWPAYVRLDIADGGGIAAGFDAVTGTAKTTENTQILTFPAHDGASLTTITHIGIWDAATTGNLLYYGALTTSRAVNPADIVSFQPNDLDVSIT